MQLVWPGLHHLDAYRQALERGWSPDNVRGAAAAAEELQRISTEPAAFVASMVDREARGGPVTLPDGSQVPRLPGYRRWIFAGAAGAPDDGRGASVGASVRRPVHDSPGEFCGVIGLRWQRGTSALPAHVLGHIGYAIVPWQRGRGHATAALRAMLPAARAEGLRWIELTTDADNAASQRVILAAGGVLVETFDKPAAFGGKASLRYRIVLDDASGVPCLRRPGTDLSSEPLESAQ